MENLSEKSPGYVAVSCLVRADRDDGSFSLYHPGQGTSLDVEPESAELVETLLERFAEPCTLEAFVESEPDFPEELLGLMIRSCFVVAEDEADFLEHGFLKPTPTPLGPAWSWSDLPELAPELAGELASQRGWVVVGVPVDMAAAGSGGARHGPGEIRKVVNGPLLGGDGDVLDHEFRRLYPALRPQVADLGDIDPDGSRMDHVGKRLGKVVSELLLLRLRPLVLGGDHSVTHHVLSQAIAQGQRFGIIHFDAHHDMGPSHTLSHANVFGEAIESPEVVSILQIGLRVIERVSPYASRVPCPKRQFITAREAQRGRALAALEALPRDIPYYLSFDIDCIDAAVARETGTPAFGGLSFELASELVDTIARSFDLLGADIVEVSGQQTAPNAAALIAASLLQRILLGQSEFTDLASDVYVFGG
jgi:arginase family enzyme